MPRGRKSLSDNNLPDNLAAKLIGRRGSGTSVSSESSDGGSSRRKGNREDDYSNRKEDIRERKLHKKEDIESIEEDASKTILDDISNKDEETSGTFEYIASKATISSTSNNEDLYSGSGNIDIVIQSVEQTRLADPDTVSSFKQLQVETTSRSQEVKMDRLEILTDSILISPTDANRPSSVASLTTSSFPEGLGRVHAAVVNYPTNFLVDQIEELEDEFLQSSPQRKPTQMQDGPLDADIYEGMDVDEDPEKVEEMDELSNILEKCPTPNIVQSPAACGSPSSQPVTPDTTKKKRLGRPKGSKNKAKTETLLSTPNSDSNKVRPGSKPRSGRESHSSCSAASTPRSLSPADGTTHLTDAPPTPVQKHLEKVRKGSSRRRNSQDKHRSEGGESVPLPSANSPGHHKPSRRGSKFSDSEDSVVSTDSPLKPRNFTGSLAEQGMERKHPVKITKVEKVERLEEKGSPVEEQPLIPHSYLQHRKMMEKEGKEKEGKEKERREKGEKKEKQEQDIKPKVEEKISAADRLRQEAEDKKDVEARLRGFKHITENIYLCQKKINKQFRKMQCDCDQTKEEAENQELGCFDDCANRMLMIECGKDCPLENNCANKRIQNKENANIEVFKTPWKGFGIRARESIPKDTFIMEYVGEALDHKQFRRRAKQYARTNVEHFYFMALSKDCYVDATNKGNISRFINHSCDPNSMTQKWMVNGENRVGFFTTRDVEEGEELNFDYKYERYGQAAQKCFCGTSICRGWLGREPTSDSGIEELEEWTTSEDEDEEDRQEKDEKSVKEEKKKKERREKRRGRGEEKRRWREEEEWEEDLQRLKGTGIKNRIHTILLCRLMVRASQPESRMRLTQLLLDADRPCRRLFLDYQGLRILSQWMQDLEWSVPDLEMKLRIENVLAELPIPHKTMLKDSKVYSSTELWSLATPANPNPVIPDKERETGAPGTPSGPSRRPSTTHSTPSATPSATPAAVPSTPVRPSSAQSMEIDLEPINSPDINIGFSEEEDLYPPGEEPLPPHLRDAPDNSAGAPPANPGCEPACDIDDDIQVLEEISGSKHRSRPTSRNSDMKLKIVPLEEVESLEKTPAKGVPLPLEGGRRVAKLLSAQSGVGGHQEDQLGDILVLPVHREELPLTEDEERERALIISKVKEVQLRARELLDVWKLLQEVFKIPKKEQNKIRVKHEREADNHFTQGHNMVFNLAAFAKNYAETNRQHPEPVPRGGGGVYTPERANYGTPDRGSYYSPMSEGGRGARNSWNRYQNTDKRQQSVVVPRERRNLRLDDASGRLCQYGLSREDRRTLFEAKIKEEADQKARKDSFAARHAQCCRLLGLDPATTPYFDNYPQFYLSGDKWVDMPAPPLPVPADWVAPGMAWLPDEAYRGDDPKPVDARDIYPPGICPPAPPPTPKIIFLPGMRSTEKDVVEYYEELWSKAPHTPTTSPRPPAGQSKPAKKEIPPYPGYPVQPVPETIIFDPETLRVPAQQPAVPVSAPVTRSSVDNVIPSGIRPVDHSSQSNRSPRQQSSRSERSPRNHRNHQSENLNRSRSRDTSPRTHRTRPEVDLSSDLQLLERVKEELNLSKTTFDLSPDYKSPSPVHQKRSDGSDTPLVQSGSPSPIPSSPNPSLLTNQRLPINFPTLVNHYTNPSPVPAPVPAPVQQSPVTSHESRTAPEPSPRRLPPKKIDFLNSAPDSVNPFPSRKEDLEPRELEICDASLAFPGPDASYPDKEMHLALIGPEGNSGAGGGMVTAGVTNGNGNGTVELTVKLPRRWKVARDGEGRVYYYHIGDRVPQWEPPSPAQEHDEETTYAEYNSNGGSEGVEEVELETNSSDEEDEEDESDDDDEKEEEGEDDTPVEEGLITGDQDLSSSEKKMLLRIRNRCRTSREERSTMRKLKRRRERARREQEREIIQARYQRHMEGGLVEERVVPRDKSNASTFKEIRERLINKEEVLKEIDKEIREDDRRESMERLEAEKQRRDLKKAEAAKRKAIAGITEPVIPALEPEPIETLIPVRSTPAKPTTAAADTSSDVHRRVRDRFVKEMSGVVVNALNPFRNPKSKGHIKNNDDFKHLAKKLTYQIFMKEKERVRSLEDLKITDKMKAKAAEWVKKKMNSYEKMYTKSPK